MSARNCFSAKVAAGKVSKRVGEKLLALIDELEADYARTLGPGDAAKQAALDAAVAAKAEAARRADIFNRQVVAQANALRAAKAYAGEIERLRKTPGDFGFGNKAPPTLGKAQTTLGYAMRSLLAYDPFDIATWANVASLAVKVRGEAHARFAGAIEQLRPKLGGLKPETTRELDMLRAAFGEPSEAAGKLAAEGWFAASEPLADQFIAAGGALAKRERYVPNPSYDGAKVKALGRDGFRALMAANVDRAKMLDFYTGKPLTDRRYRRLVDAAYDSLIGNPKAESFQAKTRVREIAHFRGSRMLANARDLPRLFEYRSSASWIKVAEAIGAHASPYEAMLEHLDGLANDIAMLRIFGPNPEATKRFILDQFEREAARSLSSGGAKAVKANRVTEARVASERRVFENLWAETTGENRIAANPEVARLLGDARQLLTASQLGSAIISSFTDPMTSLMTARFNGIPAARVLGTATRMMVESGSEIFAAQQGLVADSIAHALGAADRFMGETVRTGAAAKLSAGVIRASGLRRWTAALRSAFALETMAYATRMRETAFAALPKNFREALARYGIEAAGWDKLRATPPSEPRPNALFLRPLDVADRDLSERFMRLITQEMDHAVLERDPLARALLLGQSLGGTAGGEIRRGFAQYKMFPTAFLLMHGGRALARGWDGSRLGYGAITLVGMTMLGALSMNAKQVSQGYDARSLDPTTKEGRAAWGAALLQGGGFGVLGDMLLLDQTRYGTSWATILAGPQFSAAESVFGDFLMKNLQLAAQGNETHFLGDALYTAARYAPGSNLWYARLALQREVVDRLALMIDERSPERFRRMEATARKTFKQDMWWRPGETTPQRAPDLGSVLAR